MQPKKFGLGRNYIPDERDRLFLLAPPPAQRTYRMWHFAGPVRNQGSTPHCVAYAGGHYLRASPVINKPINPRHLYRACQRRDEWPGEDYDGTSVRALFKVLKSRGYVKSYQWAWDAHTIVQHVLTKGPAVIGTVWTTGMFYPDRYNYIKPRGQSAGGHAYLLIGANTRRKNPDGTLGAARILNSWGPHWGQNGRAWITMSDLDDIIRDGGEACASVEKKKVVA